MCIRDRPGTGALELASAACRTRVGELFQAPCPGWPRARFQCPDLMIAAASVADIEHEHYLAILGEIHPGVNTLLTHLAFHMHPERTAVCEAYDACLLYTSDAADERSSVDLGGRRIIKKKKK